MRREFIVVLTALLAAASHAEVIRCSDAAGKVSYTDGGCPSGARKVRDVANAPVSVVPGPDAAQVLASDPYGGRLPQPQVPTYNTALAGPGLIANGGVPAGDTLAYDDGYWYPGGIAYGGAWRRPLLPRIRCDVHDCRDKFRNGYNRMAQVAHYRPVSGPARRPMGAATMWR